MEGPEIQFAEAIIDNGKFGKRVVRFETGRLAKQAAGSALVTIDDDTTLLSATAIGKSPRDGFDFFPLTVDVEERMYAAGKIPGSFFRREGRPSTEAILAARLIDRPLRPAFKKGIRNEVQVVVTVLTIEPRRNLQHRSNQRSVLLHHPLRCSLRGYRRRCAHCPDRRPVGCLPQVLPA